VAFQIKQDESVARGARRMFAREVQKALDVFAQGRPCAESVHDVRKRFKKVRALLKLMRRGLGKARYQRENARFRDAARPLTEVRDAEVMVQAFDGLLERFAEELGSTAQFEPVRQILVRRNEENRNKVLDDTAKLAAVATDVRAARLRLKSRSFKPGGWQVVEAGLERTFRQGQEALRAASQERTVEQLHEWRKRVKDLWHQLQFLEPACPAVLGAWADRCHDLSDALGDDHDLFVLGQVLEEEEPGPGSPEAEGSDVLGRLQELIDRRRKELQESAFELGQQIYEESPYLLVGRLHEHWKVWRAGRQPVEALSGPGG
jgi:CHAD domain-containing protein